MMDWYSFLPQDTLFFRGAEPAVMGESHTASPIFPPPAQTLAGALRTAVLLQHGIEPRSYNEGRILPQQVAAVSAIGPSGTPSPFNVIGPFFLQQGRFWVPCPYCWFTPKDDGPPPASSMYNVTVGRPVANRLIVSKSGDRLYWAKGNNLNSLGGRWVPLEELYGQEPKKTIKKTGDFFVSEIRTGIALDVKASRRSVRDGHLYAFVHARLLEGVELAFGTTQSLPLAESGVLKLGAEQRFGAYRRVAGPRWGCGASDLFMTLSLLEAGDEANRHCVATGRILYYGGWDLHRRFHKPMKGYFPPGSVFDKQVNDNCIAL